jgi:type IV secretory pathway VirB4 component
LIINEQEFTCSLALRVLPSEVRPGWLRPLIQLDEIIDISIHQWPRDPAVAVDMLRRKQTHYEASVLYAQTKGKHAAPLISKTAQDIGPLIDEVAAGNERLHDTAFHLLVRGENLDDLERRIARVSEALYAVTHHRPQRLLYEQEQGFRQSLPGSRQAAGNALLLPSSVVASLLPFFSNLLYQPTPTSVLTGITPGREPVVVDWWRQANYNQFVIAPPGRGKSYKVKLDLVRVFSVLKAKAAREGKAMGEPTFQLIVIDPEREYRNACLDLGGQWVHLAPGSSHNLNIFDLPRRNRATQRDETTIKEDILANQIQRLHQILDLMLAHRSPDNPGASLTMEEKALLDVCLYETYRRVGITSDPATQGRPAPLLRDLYHVLESGDCGADLTGLAPRLRRYVYGSLSGLFSGPTNVELENSLVVFDLRELDSELRPIVLTMIATHTWNAAYGSLIPRQLIIDELATLYRYTAGARFADELFQRARKHYLGITGITQHPELFQHSAIISQCAMKVILGVGQDEAIGRQIQELFGLTDRESKIVRNMPIGEGLLLADGKRMHLRFVASPAEHRLATTNPVELAQWEQERRRQEEAAATTEIEKEEELV